MATSAPSAAITSTPRRLLWITTSLGTGGAEMMLYKLIAALDRRQWQVQVVCLLDAGAIGPRLTALGVPVLALNIRGIPTPATLAQLAQVVRSFRPHLIQGWMYSGNVLAWVAHRLAPAVPWLTSIRQTLYDRRQEARITRWALALDARLSRSAQANIYVARAAVPQHVAVGYAAARATVIGNGFDTQRFRPDAKARHTWRQQLGVSAETRLIGHVARYHPMKDHANLLHAFARLRAEHPALPLCLALAGPGVSADNPALLADLAAAGLSAADPGLRLLGEQQDTPGLFAALDLFVLSSVRGEGFPNVVGEAMSCGVPCAVTDVGDAGWVVGQGDEATGKVVPPADSAALATACAELLTLSPAARADLGVRARRRIEQHFSLTACVAQFQTLWSAACDGPLAQQGSHREQ